MNLFIRHKNFHLNTFFLIIKKIRFQKVIETLKILLKNFFEQ